MGHLARPLDLENLPKSRRGTRTLYRHDDDFVEGTGSCVVNRSGRVFEGGAFLGTSFVLSTDSKALNPLSYIANRGNSK